MSKTFRKYEFASEAEATTAINELGEDHAHNVVKIGHVITTAGTYDEEGNQITAPVYASNYSVDVLWDGEALASWSSKLIWCEPFGMLIMGASDVVAEWVSTCRKLHPEFFPPPPPDEEDPA